MSDSPSSKRLCTEAPAQEPEEAGSEPGAVGVAAADMAGMEYRGGASTHVPAERGPDGFKFEYLDHTADIQCAPLPRFAWFCAFR